MRKNSPNDVSERVPVVRVYEALPFAEEVTFPIIGIIVRHDMGLILDRDTSDNRITAVFVCAEAKYNLKGRVFVLGRG